MASAIPADLPCNQCGHDYAEHVLEIPESGAPLNQCTGCLGDGWHMGSYHEFVSPAQPCATCRHPREQHGGNGGACQRILYYGSSAMAFADMRCCACAQFH